MNEIIFNIKVLGMDVPIKFKKDSENIEMSITVMGQEKTEKFSRLKLVCEMNKLKAWLDE